MTATPHNGTGFISWKGTDTLIHTEKILLQQVDELLITPIIKGQNDDELVSL
jgi:hypothetical protein